ncbi:D-isomer specific 2-hydroxyacid dehydrogenase [Biscogniauxia marginata]|nr:D-isomer specific 2-hydroxyacid dehydrogenase [Biscogniauxia marginata]
MDRPKVLLLGKIEHAHDTWASIGRLADVVTPRATNRADFLRECRSGALDGISVAYRTFESVSVTGRVDAELLSALPRTLRFVCHNGAGYDSVDVPACDARGVLVSNAPTAVDDSTADLGIFLMLGAMRNLNPGMRSLREGRWRGEGGALPALGHDPQGKVLGILGMGGIGRNVARRAARAFGMRIRYHNRARLAPEVEAECAAEYVGFEELLRSSDVLSLNLPLNSQTHHLISDAQFAQMKPGVVIVNTARGAVMDEAALVSALRSGRVGGAGLDVYEDEPRVHPGLVADPRVLLVPHMGTWTVETQTKMEEWTMSNVRAALERGTLRSVVPEQRDMLPSSSTPASRP